MNSELILKSTADMSPEDWLRYRKRGIGASEVGAIMGLSPYKSSIELFYDKIGEEIGYSIENMAMFMGKEQEPFIASMWQYWEGSQESMIANYRAKKLVRKCQRVNAYVHNPKYPWLFVSLDRKINKHGTRGEGTLELKTIGGWEADKWESGIPPSHITQVQTQILVCEFEYGELATLRDNRYFDVIPFEKHASICESVIGQTKEFWDRVEKARVILTRQFEAKRNFNQAAVDDLTAQLHELEPAPDGSDAFNDFLKKKYQIALPGERPGTLEQLETARAHKDLGEKIKELESQKQLHSNVLKNDIRDGCERLDFGANGYVSWKANTNGVRMFLNKVK